MSITDRKSRVGLIVLGVLGALLLAAAPMAAPAVEASAEVIERSTTTTVKFTPSNAFLVAKVASTDKSKETVTLTQKVGVIDSYIAKAQGFVSISATNAAGPIVISHPDGVQHAVRVLVDGVPKLGAFFEQSGIPIMTSTGPATMTGTTNVYPLGPLTDFDVGLVTLEWDMTVSPGTALTVTFAGTLH